MGGVAKKIKKAFKSVTKAVGLGGGGSVKMPSVPDYEAERKKAEDEAAKKRNALAGQGMSGTILGGSFGDDEQVKKKKLLGE